MAEQLPGFVAVQLGQSGSALDLRCAEAWCGRYSCLQLYDLDGCAKGPLTGERVDSSILVTKNACAQ